MQIAEVAEAGPSGSEVTLAISTIVLAIATLGLVLVGWLTARAALAGLHESQRAVRADHARRRGEATMLAVQRYMERSVDYHEKLLVVARKETAKRRQATSDAPKVSIIELLRLPPQEGDLSHFKALHAWLDELEALALGMRLGVYDVHVAFHLARSVIRLLWEQATPYVQDVRAGHFDERPAQPSAYEHTQWLWERFEELDGKVPVQLEGTLPSID